MLCWWWSSLCMCVCDSVVQYHFMVHLAVMLQPSEVVKSDTTAHKMMVQYFFPPAGVREIRLEDMVSQDKVHVTS